jgi:hypothetical protein
MERIRQDIYLHPEVYIKVYTFMREKALSNVSQALNLMIPEYFRFKTIALKLQEASKNDSDKNK